MEKMEERGRRGIIVGGMVLGLLLGCNNGGELEAEKRLSAIGRSAENVFYSFMDLIADTLGLRVTEKTTKQAVGEHLNKLGVKIGEASDKLEEVAKKAETGDDKSDSSKNLIREAVEAAKATLSVLKGHLEALKEIGDSSLVGEAVAHSAAKEGTKPADPELNKALKALKGIVETAKKEGISGPEEGATAVKIGSSGTDNSAGAKILATNASGNPDQNSAGKAASILTTVSGKEILAEIFKSTENDPQIDGGSGATKDTTAVSFAKGNSSGATLAQNTAKAAAVAGGIALRSLVKDGKLATGANNGQGGGKEEVQKVGVTAVNKLLIAVEDIIKKTVNETLKRAKEKIDKARESKSAVQ